MTVDQHFVKKFFSISAAEMAVMQQKAALVQPIPVVMLKGHVIHQQV